MSKFVVFGLLSCVLSMVVSMIGMVKVLPKVLQFFLGALGKVFESVGVGQVLDHLPMPVVLTFMLVLATVVTACTVAVMILPVFFVHGIALDRLLPSKPNSK